MFSLQMLFQALAELLPEYGTSPIQYSQFVVSHSGPLKILWDWMILTVAIYVAVILPYTTRFNGPRRPFITSYIVAEALLVIGK